MVAPSSSATPATPAAPVAGLRTAAVVQMAKLQRHLFELERAFIASAPTLVPRVGEPELKYLLCQHVWEGASHGRFLRERGREMNGFGKSDTISPEIWQVFHEATVNADPDALVAGFYRVLKPYMLATYEHYLAATHPLADWPSLRLVEEFIGDEKRHAEEIQPWLKSSPEIDAWCAHLEVALTTLGRPDGQAAAPVPADFTWQCVATPYAHPSTCNRAPYPVCSSAFSHDPKETPIVRPWLEDPATDARVIRMMIYVWLMMEMDAVDYISTIFPDTLDASFAMHHDLARHLWDESRHSQFGFRQLPKLGVDLMTLEHSVDLFDILSRMPAAERYAMLTMEFEANSFPIKAKIMDRVRELNDFEADTLLAFDRNDEQNHVRYGHQWLPEIMKIGGYTQPVGEFIKSSVAHFEEMAKEFGGKTPHALSAEKRLTGEKILELIK